MAGKPAVAFKVGCSEAGAKVAVSHAGAMAGTDRMYDDLFRQTGVIRAPAFGDLLDFSAALATRRVLRGRRIAIFTSTAGTRARLCPTAWGSEAPAPTSSRQSCCAPRKAATIPRSIAIRSTLPWRACGPICCVG